jgi:DNA repair photolyase
MGHRSFPVKGRGAVSNPAGRFETRKVELVDDGWQNSEAPQQPTQPVTQVSPEPCKTIISRNDSPDVPFEQSINPYRGCEHGCVYCFARPTHAYLNLSPGLDFETRLFFKERAAERLVQELARPGYRVTPIALGANTDPYQPIERRLKVTRSILEVLWSCRHPCTIVTKGTLIERDLDLLVPMAAARLVSVMVSVTTLNDDLKRVMEPRAAAPRARLATIQTLANHGIPVGALIAPVIPAINDNEIEQLVEAVAVHGAGSAGFVMLRLPNELRILFRDWLDTHFPLKAQHVMTLIRQMRGGRENDPRFGTRMRGEGDLAALIGQRFKLAARRAGLDRGRHTDLDTRAFRPPRPATAQLGLF